MKNLLSELSSISCLYPKDTEAIQTYFKLLTSEDNFTVIEGILKALLAKIVSSSQPRSSGKGKDGDIMMKFRELLNNSDDLKNKVSYYAEKLNTTPQNLNTLSRKTFERSASEIIAEYIINETKRLLIYTGNSISEIAYLLNFNDTSHFVKYFKRYTGCTPGAYRDK